MKITFLGVGEAFDDVLPNNSHLLESPQANILFDCGYSVAQPWFRLGKPGNFLHAINISHKHWDHYAGLPPILFRLSQAGRTEPLIVFCQKEHRQFFVELAENAYRGFPANFGYKTEFVGVEAGQTVEFRGLKLSYAPTIHSIENLAVRIDDGQKAYGYSGDGQFISQTEELYAGCDLVIQETFLYDQKRDGHASIVDAIDMAQRRGVKTLALSHMERDFRKKELPALREKILASKGTKVLIPEPGDAYKI